jgi:hypothetical protein
MKLKSSFVFGVIALAAAQFASAQVVINITGATAFRDAADSALKALLDEGTPGTTPTQYARADIPLNGASTSSNLRIYRGKVTPGGTQYIVRCTYSGSTQGVLDAADGNTLSFLNQATVPFVTTGTGTIAGATQANSTVTGIPRWSFSDVDQALSTRPNEVFYAPPGTVGSAVGVVPFMFIAGEGAPAGMTNMTDQLHEVLWSTGQVSASFFTGAASTTTVLATGRNNGSGTRATILSETGYGSFTGVYQYRAVFTGDQATGALGAISLFQTLGVDDPNSGNVSNSDVRNLLNRPRTGLTFGGDAVDAVFCSYLTISDALGATGYQPLTNTIVGGEGAIPMTYNGVRYSVAGVQNGAYTLWGYQQLYLSGESTTAAEIAFDTLFRASFNGNLGSAGIDLSGMLVDRVGGDGGLIQPKP